MADITTTSSSKISPVVGGRNTSSVGGFESDASKLPFIREQDIAIYASGMRPNTKLYVFFDNKLVSAYVTPATFDFNIKSPSVSDFRPAGVRGGDLKSDANGLVAGILHIPAGTFFTGDRLIVITDVNNLKSLSSATTVSTYTFNAFNYSITDVVDSAVVAPRPVSTTISTTVNNRVETTTATSSVTNVTNITNNVIAETIPQEPEIPFNFDFIPFDFSGITLTGFDPIAQSIFIGSDGLKESDGVFVTGVNLYFESKDPTLGVTVEMRTMDNGVPTTTVLPFGRVRLTPSEVNISSDGTAITQATFPSPVFLAADFNYAICIVPDGNSPNYRVHTSVVGQTDILSGSVITRNWGSGDLFTSTNGSTWVPIPNEFLKFDLRVARFKNRVGGVRLVNRDFEYIVPDHNYTSGYFEQGEYAFQLSANLFANGSNVGTVVTTNTSSYIVTTGNTNPGFSSLNSNSVIVVSNGSVYDVLFVNSISSNTSMTVKNLPKFSSTTASIQNTPVGKVYLYDPKQYDLTLVDSTARSGFVFTQNSVVIGVNSKANTRIQMLRDRVINRFNPYLYTTSVSGTSVRLDMSNVTWGPSSYDSTPYKTYDLSNITYIVDKEIVVASRSNEITKNSGNKSLVANVVMTTTNGRISPVIDLQSSSILGYRNIIDNSANNENTRNGTAKNKYISKTITLDSSLESDELIVYLTAYKPANTYIKVYGKFLSATDSDTIDAKEWTLLEQVGGQNLYSDPVDMNDVKEYQYKIPTSPPSTPKVGVLTIQNANATIVGLNTTFTTDLAVNDLIKVYGDGTKTSFQIAKVNSIANNTQLVLDNTITLASSVSAIYEKIDLPKSAFINSQNGNVLRYYGSDGSIHDSFISYAIKIIPLSDTTYLTPRIHDVRAIAVI